MSRLRVTSAFLAFVALSATTFAQGQSSPSSHQVTWSGYVQPQYELVSREHVATDRLYFRRIMIALDTPVVPEWTARVQVDFAPLVDGDNVVLKDAYVRYNGLSSHGLTFTFGNQKTPFSRTLLGSSSRRSVPERGFIGDRNFGSPGRSISARVDGMARHDHLQWIAAVGSALVSPDITRVRIDGIAEAGDDWNEGILATGRIEFHPFGPTSRDQGYFGGPNRLVISAAAYVWTNDDDVNDYTRDGIATSALKADVETVSALELSAGWRGERLSIDGEYHRVAANTIDPGFSGGLYTDGETGLHESGIEAGVMLLPRRVEALGAFDTLAVDGRDAITWRPSFGAAYYVAAHTLKIAVMHRETFNDAGISGRRLHATYVQAQFAF